MRRREALDVEQEPANDQVRVVIADDHSPGRQAAWL